MPHWILDVLLELGAPLALLIFFVWRDWKREVYMFKVISDLRNHVDDLQTEMQTNLYTLVQDTSNLLKENITAMRQMTQSVLKIPCFVCEKFLKEHGYTLNFKKEEEDE